MSVARKVALGLGLLCAALLAAFLMLPREYALKVVNKERAATIAAAWVRDQEGNVTEISRLTPMQSRRVKLAKVYDGWYGLTVEWETTLAMTDSARFWARGPFASDVIEARMYSLIRRSSRVDSGFVSGHK